MYCIGLVQESASQVSSDPKSGRTATAGSQLSSEDAKQLRSTTHKRRHCRRCSQSRSKHHSALSVSLQLGRLAHRRLTWTNQVQLHQHRRNRAQLFSVANERDGAGPCERGRQCPVSVATRGWVLLPLACVTTVTIQRSSTVKTIVSGRQQRVATDDSRHRQLQRRSIWPTRNGWTVITRCGP